MKMREMNYEEYIGERCGCCVMPKGYKAMRFDNGRCEMCSSFTPKTFKGGEALVRDLDLNPGEKVGITVSGGKDSILMWGVLADYLGQNRVQAFTYFKEGLSSEVALENVKKAGRVLNSTPHIVYESASLERFRRNFRCFMKRPDPASVRVLLCAGCRYGITEQLYRLGEQEGITKYISGASYLELAPFKEELLMCKSHRHDIDDGLEEVIREYPSLAWGDNLSVIRRDQKYKYKNNETLGNNFSTGTYRYKLYDFDDYFENDPFKVEAIVRDRFGWEKTDRSWHFDCSIEDLKDVFYFGFLGYTELDFKLSAMVRYGLIDRATAIEELCAQAKSIRTSAPKICALLIELGLEDTVPEMMAFYDKYIFLKEDRIA